VNPLHVEILVHACCRADVFPRRGAPAVEIAIDDLVKEGAIERRTEANMICATPMGQAWLSLICRTPAPKQAWVDGEGRVIQ
jgi:hypothetical protein